MATATESMGNRVSLISDGSFQLDGGLLFGSTPKVDWESELSPDRKNRVRVGLNSLLIQSPSGVVLVNTGIGSMSQHETREQYGHSTSKLLREIRKHKVNPRDVKYVILTHLHFDHSGGAVRLNTNGQPAPTFPNARYIIQRRAWEELNNLSIRQRQAYGPGIENLQVLADMDRIDFIDGDLEFLPGIHIEVTDGYSDGHSIVHVNTGSERYAYLGDLVPTPAHICTPVVTGHDKQPERTIEVKTEVLKRAMQEHWLLVFAHGYKARAGYLTPAGLKPIDF